MRGATALIALCAMTAAAAHLQPRPAAGAPVQGSPGAINPRPTGDPAATGASKPDPLNAVIRGRVVRADNGQPVEGARVSASNAGSVPAVSDADGRFELTKLRAGTYALTAYANGFPSVAFGSRRLGDAGRTITLAPGQILNGIDFALPKGAVLSGTILDERGEPLPMAAVWVLRPRFIDGERRLMRATPSDPSSGTEGADVTDDLGRFRIFGLPAGTYFLAARPPDAGQSAAAGSEFYETPAPALYPTGGPLAEARPVTVAAGQELSGLSFAVRPVRTASITVVLSSRNGPVAGEVFYWQLNGTSYTVRTQADGRYSFSRQPPGTYTFLARVGDQVAFARVEVNGEDVLVPLAMTRGGTVRGRIVTDVELPDGLRPADVNVRARLLQVSAQTSNFVRATVMPDLSFELTGVSGPIHLTGSAAGGWITKQLLADGTDVTGMPLDASRDVDGLQLVLTKQVVELTGSVRDARGRAAADATVLIFADDPDKRWNGTPYLRTARAGGDGRFTLRGVPAGRYRAVAVDFLENGDETNPDLPAQLDSASVPVTLSNGVTTTLDLRLAPWP